MSVWKDESSILKRVRKSRFFPRIYESKPGYIIREYVDGVRLDKYLRRGNLDEELCKELYLMILEFERLGFKRIDIRCKDIYIQDDYTLKIMILKITIKREYHFQGIFLRGFLKEMN